MHARRLRAIALATGLGLAVTFVPSPVSATAPSAPLSDAYCEPFGDFYAITVVVELSVALFEAFSQLPDATEESSDTTSPPDDVPDAEQLRASYYALLSPKMADVTAALEKTGPKVLRSFFRQSNGAFERGIELLQDAGFTEAQIDAIAEVSVDPTTTQIGDLTGDVDLTDEEFETLSLAFLSEMDKLELTEPSPKQNRALDRSATECGVTPSDGYDCDDMLPESEAAAILADEVTLESGGCDYTGPEPVDGLTPEIEVLVYDSERAFDLLTGSIDTAEDVDGIGDRAMALEGFNADGHTITCGRTLVLADGDRTVVVALCLGGDDPEVTDDQLVEIADGVLERIA